MPLTTSLRSVLMIVSCASLVFGACTSNDAAPRGSVPPTETAVTEESVEAGLSIDTGVSPTINDDADPSLTSPTSSSFAPAEAPADGDSGPAQVGASSSSPSASVANPGTATYVANGKLVICSDLPFAPFEFQADDGTFRGIDVDIMTAVAKDLGRTIEVVDTDFGRIFAALAAGECDVVASGVAMTEERRQASDFTDSYFRVTGSLLVRKADSNVYVDLASLKGRTLAVQSGTIYADYLAAEGAKNNFSVKEFGGTDEILSALKTSQVDAVLQDGPINAFRAVNNPADFAATGGSIDVLGTGGDPYGFAVKKNNLGLVAAINAGLAKVRNDGRYAAIIRTYLGAYRP